MQLVIVDGAKSHDEEKMYVRNAKSYKGGLTVEISRTEDFADTNQLVSVEERDGKLRVVAHGNFAEEYLPYIEIDPTDDEVDGHIKVQKD
jgi:hypothetical protein